MGLLLRTTSRLERQMTVEIIWFLMDPTRGRCEVEVTEQACWHRLRADSVEALESVV